MKSKILDKTNNAEAIACVCTKNNKLICETLPMIAQNVSNHVVAC